MEGRERKREKRGKGTEGKDGRKEIRYRKNYLYSVSLTSSSAAVKLIHVQVLYILCSDNGILTVVTRFLTNLPREKIIVNLEGKKVSSEQ